MIREGKATMGPAKEFFADTRLEVAWRGSKSRKHARLFLADATAVAWDGAKAETNGALFLEGPGSFAYVEVKLTGRAPRSHGWGLYGTKARVRFTSADDSGEWFDAVVRSVTPAEGSVV